GFKCYGFFKTFYGFFSILGSNLIMKMQAFQKQCVGLNIFSGDIYKLFLRFRSQILTTLICYNVADLILHFKYICKVTVVIFTPDMISVGRIDQLCRNAYAVAGFTYTSFQYSVYVELNANFTDVSILSFKSKGRCSG